MSNDTPKIPVLTGRIEHGELTAGGAVLHGWVSSSYDANRILEISVTSSGIVAQTIVVSTSAAGKPSEFLLSVPRSHFPVPVIIELAVVVLDRSSETKVSLAMIGTAADLQAVRILSREDFLRNVQSPSDRLKSGNLLFYISLYGLERFSNDFVSRSAAICVMAYRVMEGVSVDDEARQALWHGLETVLTEHVTVPRGLWLRWHISVRLAAGYLAFRDGDALKSASYFSGIGDFAFELSHWPSALTNVLIGIFLAGWVKYKNEDFTGAIVDWRRAEGVLRYGSTIAHLGNFYAYGELANAVKVAQECYIGLKQAEDQGKSVNDSRFAPVGYNLDIAHLPGLKHNLGL